MSEASLYLTGTVVNTPLTPNCEAAVNALFDLNDSTWVYFYQVKTPIWAALLSVASVSVTLEQDVNSSGITLLKGLQLTFNAISHDYYTILLTGTILDSGASPTPYQFSGKDLGTFSRTAEAKLAVQSIREAATRLTLVVENPK